MPFPAVGGRHGLRSGGSVSASVNTYAGPPQLDWRSKDRPVRGQVAIGRPTSCRSLTAARHCQVSSCCLGTGHFCRRTCRGATAGDSPAALPSSPVRRCGYGGSDSCALNAAFGRGRFRISRVEATAVRACALRSFGSVTTRSQVSATDGAVASGKGCVRGPGAGRGPACSSHRSLSRSDGSATAPAVSLAAWPIRLSSASLGESGSEHPPPRERFRGAGAVPGDGQQESESDQRDRQ